MKAHDAVNSPNHSSAIHGYPSQSPLNQSTPTGVATEEHPSPDAPRCKQPMPLRSVPNHGSPLLAGPIQSKPIWCCHRNGSSLKNHHAVNSPCRASPILASPGLAHALHVLPLRSSARIALRKISPSGCYQPSPVPAPPCRPCRSVDCQETSGRLDLIVSAIYQVRQQPIQYIFKLFS